MVEVLMPGVGAGTTHGKVIQWLKQVGDTVAVGDVLAEIETDKAVIELEAFDEGVLTRIVAEAGGEEVEVGAVVAEIEPAQSTGRAEVSESAQPAEQAAASITSTGGDVSAAVDAVTPVDSNRIFASPSARRLARELDVDLAQLTGSGPLGRIVRVDIERAHAQAPEPMHRFAQPSSTPHSAMRKTIARRLQESKQNVPHFYLSIDVEVQKLLKLRGRLNKALESCGDDLRLSLNDLVTYSVGKAVADCPDINVRWTPEAVEQLPQADLSVAVATEKGLITPIVRDVGAKKLNTVARELRGLTERARAGRLAPAEYEGGSMTISNLGMYGVRQFSAIINPRKRPFSPLERCLTGRSRRKTK